MQKPLTKVFLKNTHFQGYENPIFVCTFAVNFKSTVMRKSNSLKSVLTILLLFTLFSCNMQNADKQDKSLNQKQLKITPDLPITSEPTDITPSFSDGWFNADKITDKGLIAFATINYDQNKIKIALPAYSDSDVQEVFTGVSGKTFVVDIKIQESDMDFAFTSYTEVDVEDVNQYDNYLIRIFSEDSTPVLIYDKNIEREDITDEPGSYSQNTNSYELETFEVQQHFYDFYQEDSCIFITDPGTQTDSVWHIEFFEVTNYTSQITSVDFVNEDGYLFLNINTEDDIANPLEIPETHYFSIDISLASYNGGKIKIKKSRRSRKTIARSPNKNN